MSWRSSSFGTADLTPSHSSTVQVDIGGRLTHNPASGPWWSAFQLSLSAIASLSSPALSQLVHPLQQSGRSGASSPALRTSSPALLCSCNQGQLYCFS